MTCPLTRSTFNSHRRITALAVSGHGGFVAFVADTGDASKAQLWVVDTRSRVVTEVPIPDGPLYISIDLDALDPAFAPGVSHHEPGGLSVRDILAVLHRVRAPIVGADVVEYNPSRDVNGMTAVVAAKLVKEIAAVAAGGNA